MEVLIEERTVKKVPIRVSPEGEKHRDEMLAQGRCLGCGEKLNPKDENKRGLHPKCYGAYRRAVKRGETTEKEVVRNGKMLEPSPGRPLTNPFARQLAGK